MDKGIVSPFFDSRCSSVYIQLNKTTLVPSTFYETWPGSLLYKAPERKRDKTNYKKQYIKF